MKKLLSIGEALIDFIPNEIDKLKNINSFTKACGGAPANVCAAYSKLGGKALMLTKLGKDAFGDFIIDTLNNVNIDTSLILRDTNYDTSLAFVSLDKDGNREFSFYRKTAADLNYDPSELPSDILNKFDVIHFCSVDLVPSKMKDTHTLLLDKALKNNKIISFDPNLRFPLWDDLNLLKKTVKTFIKYATILKISDEELEFITGTSDINKASKNLFNNNQNLKVILYTLGKDGSMVITKNNTLKVDGIKVNAIDTTGAGDAFAGSFLYFLLNENVDNIEGLKNALTKANLYAALSTTKNGAITSYLTYEEFKRER